MKQTISRIRATIVAIFIAHVLTPALAGPWHTCTTRRPDRFKTLVENNCLPRPENVGIAHQKAVAYYESGCFDKEIAAFVENVKAQFTEPAQNDMQTIIFDIDETVLSDYCNIKKIQFGYIPKLSHKWILQASAPAIPAMKDLYLYLLGKGYRIVFLTGRKYNEYEATQKNLEKEGFIGYDRLIVKPEEDHHTPNATYKARERAKLTKEGYEIVATFGDQATDLMGGETGKPFQVPAYMYSLA